MSASSRAGRGTAISAPGLGVGLARGPVAGVQTVERAQRCAGETGYVTGPTMGAGFTCIVANNGDFVVGSDVLSLLPATIAGPTGIGTLGVGSSVRASFDAPGSDLSTMMFLSGAGRSVGYK